jgi:hypothetical protein
MTIALEDHQIERAAIDESVIRQMIAAAILAPSAENTQPWRFLADGDQLTVLLEPARWLPSDVTGMLALTSLGAGIENAVIAARRQHVEPRVRVLVDGLLHRTDGLAEMAVIEPARDESARDADGDPLHAWLSVRCTTRRLSSRPIKHIVLAKIGDEAAAFSDVRVDWIDGGDQLREIARLIGEGNAIRFQHEPFHREFYENLRLTRQQVLATQDGLDVETLQLGRAVKAVLAWPRTWRRMEWANRFGFSHSVGRQAATEVRNSGAVGLLSIGAAAAPAMINGGRALERLWLATTAEGLGFHPTASLPVFLAYARHPELERLPAKLQKAIKRMAERFDGVFPQLRGRVVQMAFRVGDGRPAEVRSVRRPIEAVTD